MAIAERRAVEEEQREAAAPTSRVLEALKDHAMPAVIAAAADLPLPLTLIILDDLARKGLAERYTAECWGMAYQSMGDI